MFARLWYVGLALTPVLIITCFYLRSRTAATRRHAVGVAVLLALLMSTCLPIVREPGALLQNAREDFKAIGLAPCRVVRIDPTPDCFTFTHAGTWTAGWLLLLGWYGLGRYATVRLRRRARAGLGATRAEVRRIAQDLAVHCPLVGVVAGRQSPMVVGIARPMLLLPAELWAELDPPGREAVLRHELAHLRRRDLLTQEIGNLVRALFWWHPVVWWLRSEIARAAERAADAVAVAAGPDCAEALARALLTIQRCGRPAVLSPAAAQALSPAARDLADRLGEILEVRELPRSTHPVALLAFAAVLAVGWASVQVTLG